MTTVRNIGPDAVELIGEGPEWHLRNLDTGETVPVTAWEATCFRRTSSRRMEQFFLDLGGLADDRQPTSPLTAVAAALSHGLPSEDQLACLVDTTTLNVSRLAIEQPRLPFPAAILDLATLCFAVVMYDYVCCDGDELQEIPELGEIIQPIRLPDRSDLLGSEMDLAARIEDDYEHHRYAFGEVEDSWSAFLGRRVMLAVVKLHEASSAAGLEYLPAATFGKSFDPIQDIEDPASAERKAPPSVIPRRREEDEYDSPWGTNARTKAMSRYGLARDVAIQTIRYYFNERTASRLHLPYHCTSLRFPVERVALRHQARYRWLGDDLLRKTIGSPGPAPSLDQQFMPRVQLPHPLSVVLERAAGRDDIWEELLALREEFAAVRDWLRQVKSQGSETKALHDLVKRLGGSHPGAAKIDTLLAASSSVAGALPHDAGLSAASLKAVSTLKPAEKAANLLDRLRRPEVKILRSFRSQVEQLAGTTDRVERLWSEGGLTRSWLEAALKLSETGALTGARLRPISD